MIKRGIWVLVVIVVALVQTSVLPLALSSLFKPDLLLILVVFLGLRGTLEGGALSTFGLGLLKDLTSGLYLGLNAFIFLAIFVLIKSTSDRLYAESAELFVVAVALASVASISASMALTMMFTPAPAVAYSMLLALIPQVLVNSFCASLVTLFPHFSSLVRTPA